MEAYLSAGGLPEFYRCRDVNKTQDDWYASGKVNFYRGLYYLIFGIVCEILYLPCLLVLSQKDLFTISAYKLIFIICLCDMVNLATNSIFTGLYYIKGAVFCNYPYFMYIWGCFVIAAWTGGCITCFLLMLTRVVDLISPRLHDKFFGGNRIVWTIIIIILYMLYFFFYGKTTVFNSREESWMWDPVIHEDGKYSNEFTSPLYIANQAGTLSATLFLSILFFMVFIYKVYNVYNFKLERKQLQIFIQTTVMCLVNLVTAGCDVYFQFAPVGPWVALLALSSWQFSSAGGLIAFYILNQTIRKRIFALFVDVQKKLQSTSSRSPMYPAVT